MLTRPNIFNYAKKELSQDAVICWLLECCHSDDDKYRKIGIDFVRFILDNENIKEKYQLISFHECDNVIALIGCEQRYRFFVYRVYCL